MSFPEEPLNLSPAAGGPGYFPASIHQKLCDGKYEIIRKLGYGPRSSTWLVLREADDAYFAVQIFTIASSERASKFEIPILQSVRMLDNNLPLPWIQDHFWEAGCYGSHLCVILNPLSTSVEALRLEEETGKLPVHVVRRVVYCTLQGLKGLHSAHIMHGAINAENVYFVTSTQTESLAAELESEPAPLSNTIDGFVTVASQPLKLSLRGWRHKKAIVSEWPLNVGNLGHAQQSTSKPELGNDYAFAPETLLSDASCSLKTDIWMLGCMTFHLLTGHKLPFLLEGPPSRRLLSEKAVIEDKEVPSGWLNDSSPQDTNPEVAVDSTVATLEVMLSRSLTKAEAEEAAGFIRDCLRLDPNRRLDADECLRHKWLSTASACSCGYC